MGSGNSICPIAIKPDIMAVQISVSMQNFFPKIFHAMATRIRFSTNVVIPTGNPVAK